MGDQDLEYNQDLEDIFIDSIAEKYGVSGDRVEKAIADCIVELKLTHPKKDVYSIILQGDPISKEATFSHLKACDLPSTIKFEGDEIPLFFPDAERMNRDPDAYVEGMSTMKLEKLVKIASYLHFNYGSGGITDNTYEAFEYILNKRLKTSKRRYEKIGAPPVDRIRTVLPMTMPSLEKVKPGTARLQKFLTENPVGTIVYSAKLDGVSLQVHFVSGVATKAFTRGDGTIGGDVSYILEHIKGIPRIPIQENIVVRGELIVKKKLWNKLIKDECILYSNPRAFVSAIVNSGTLSTKNLSFMTFVVYLMVDNGESISPTPSWQMEWFSNMGFVVVEWGTLRSPTTFDIISTYKTIRENSEFNIDGLVMAYDVQEDTEDVTALAQPRPSRVAFKMLLQAQIRNTTVINVEWNISRYGRFVPVAVYESVYIDNVRLHRASAFNAGKVDAWKLGKGSKITVARSGDVIPAIIDVEVNEFIDPIYPPLTEEDSWHREGADIVLDDISNNKSVQIKVIEYFFATIGVKGLGEATSAKLWEEGMKTVRDITMGNASAFKKMKGFGIKKAKSLYENIHSTLRKTRIDRFVSAYTLPKSGINKATIRKVLFAYPNVMDASEDEITGYLTKNKIKGIGPKTIPKIAKGIPIFKEFLYSLCPKDIEYAIKHDRERIQKINKEGGDERIQGKKVVVTGFFGHFDENAEDYIYDNKGEIANTVDDKTMAVISASFSFSKKVEKAMELGIPVLTLDEFREIFMGVKPKEEEGEETVGAKVVKIISIEEEEKPPVQPINPSLKVLKPKKISTSPSKQPTKSPSKSTTPSKPKILGKKTSTSTKQSPKEQKTLVSSTKSAPKPKTSLKSKEVSKPKKTPLEPKKVSKPKTSPKRSPKTISIKTRSPKLPPKFVRPSRSQILQKVYDTTFESLVEEIKSNSGPLPRRLAALLVISTFENKGIPNAIASNKFFKKGLVAKAVAASSNSKVKRSLLRVIGDLSILSGAHEFFVSPEGGEVDETKQIPSDPSGKKIKFSVFPGTISKSGEVVIKEFVET